MFRNDEMFNLEELGEIDTTQLPTHIALCLAEIRGPVSRQLARRRSARFERRRKSRCASEPAGQWNH